MRKFVFSFIFLLALAASSFATVVTVGAYAVSSTWTFGGSTATLRIYATKSFLTSTNTSVIGGTSSGFYKTVNCTVSGTTVTCEALTLDSTTDSSVPSARYVADLYDSNNKLRARFVEPFQVPTSLGTSITWPQLLTYNAAPAAKLPITFPTTDQVAALIADKQNALICGTTVKTINSACITGSGDLAVAPGVASLANTYSNSLSTAIASIGSTKTTLLIDADTSVSVGIAIPSTLTIKQSNNAKITLSGVGSINCAGKCINGDERNLISVSSQPAYLWLNTTAVTASTDNIHSVAHGFSTGQQLRFTVYKYGSGNSVIGGLSDNGLYYAIRVDADNFKLATSYANALAATAIDLTSVGAGTFYFNPSPIAFTGTDYPTEISTGVIDTGDTSESKRVNFLARAFAGTGVTIKAVAQTVDDNIFLGDRQTLDLLPGTHQNSFAGGSSGFTFFPYSIPIILGSNSRLTGEPGSVLMESSVNFQTSIATIFGDNSRIDHLYVLGQGAAFDGIKSGVSIFGGFNDHITDNVFDTTTSYTVSIVPTGNAPISYCSMERNLIKNTITQVLFIGGGDHIDMLDNVVTTRNFTPAIPATFVFVDLEPNSDLDQITDVRIDRNRFDTRGLNDSIGVFSFIRVNTSSVASGFKRIYVRNNEAIANETTGTQLANALDMVQMIGTDGFEISGNHSHGISYLAGMAQVYYSRRGRVFNNTSTNGGGNIGLQGTVDTEVTGNRLFQTPESGASQVGVIDESAFGRYPLSSVSGSTITLYYGIVAADFRGELYPFFVNARGYLNNDQYTIATITPGSFESGSGFGTATFTASASAEPSAPITVASSTDVNTSTDTITKTAHGLNTGAAIHYEPGTGAIGGLGTFTEHFVIKTDADHFKLASTYANAIAGTAEDITSTGTGTQKFILTFVIFSYNNDFHENPDMPVTLGPLTTSVDRTPNTPVVQTLTTGTVTVDTTKGGTRYENTGASAMPTIVIPTTANIGKEYKFFVSDAKGLKVQTPFATIIDGSTTSALHGFTSSFTVGSSFTLTKLTATKYGVTEKLGTTNTPTISGATLVENVDIGRTAGGTVAGWDADICTGGSAATFSTSPFTANTSYVVSPATNDVYQTSRKANTSFQCQWTGRDISKAHLVRLHIIDGGPSDPAPTGTLDVDINGLQVQDNFTAYIPNVTGVGLQTAAILEYYVPAGVTTVTVTISGPAGSFAAEASGIQLYQLP